ncbi:MAG TPA: large conductance mechanosensitive channel protein MscL [Acidimicrobiia bacterium]|jgi:large conductance mechanosensitive channel
MIREFRDFIARGNIIELAVAFVMGVAFSAVVTTFTDRIVNPLIGLLLPGLDNLEGLGTFADGGSIGAFIGSVINFLLVALVLFFIVKAYNRFQKEQPEEPVPPSEEIVLLTEIRDALRRGQPSA